MANTIITKNSATASAVPTSGDLVQGELAVNVTDKRLFTENSSGTVVELGTNPSSLTAPNITDNATTATLKYSGAAKLATTSTGIDVTGLTDTDTLNVSGNVTLGDASTDTVKVNGYMGVGVSPASGIGIYVNPNYLVGAAPIGVFARPTGTASATTATIGVSTQPASAAAAYTVTDVIGAQVQNATKGAGSTITNLHGVYINDQTQGTNNYGITSLVSSGTNKWNIYASGTAANYFAGNVGIGTSSPAGKLHVVSSANSALVNAVADDLIVTSNGNTGITIGSDAASSGNLFFSDNSSNSVGFIQYDHASNFMRFQVNATERLRIDSAGNVGIGTSSPVFSTGGGIEVSHVSSANLRLNSDAGGAAEIRHGTGLTIETRTAEPVIIGTNATERLRLDAAGNLGLGVTPSAWTGLTAMQIGQSAGFVGHSTANFNYILSNAYYNGVWRYKVDGYALRYTLANNAYTWDTAPSGTAGTAISFTQAMTLDASGNLLVGKTTASNTTEGLQLASDGIVATRSSTSTNLATNSGGALRLFNSSATDNNFSNIGGYNSNGLVTSQIDFINVSHASRTGAIAFLTHNGATMPERARITSDGTLLVGKTTTDFGTVGLRLDPTGQALFTRDGSIALFLNRLTSDGETVRFHKNSISVGNISVTASSTSYNTSSDYRLKEDWQPMVGASERVKALKPVNFAWKADGSRVDGFLAHEAQAVVPEAVTGEKDAVDSEGKPVYQGIDQSKLVPLLTAALQEALAQIEEQKTALDVLTARVSALEGN